MEQGIDYRFSDGITNNINVLLKDNELSQQKLEIKQHFRNYNGSLKMKSYCTVAY